MVSTISNFSKAHTKICKLLLLFNKVSYGKKNLTVIKNHFKDAFICSVKATLFPTVYWILKITHTHKKMSYRFFLLFFQCTVYLHATSSDSEPSIYQSLHLANKSVWKTMRSLVSCVFLLPNDKSAARARRSVPLLLEGPAICPLASEWHRQWEKKEKKNTGKVAGNVSKQMRADCGLGFFLR